MAAEAAPHPALAVHEQSAAGAARLGVRPTRITGIGDSDPARPTRTGGPPAPQAVAPDPVTHRLGQPAQPLVPLVGVTDVGVGVVELLEVYNPEPLVAGGIDGDGGGVIGCADVVE